MMTTRRSRPQFSRFWVIVLGLFMTSCAMGRTQMASRGLASAAPEPRWPLVGLASWYSESDPGVQPLTASGEPFDDTAMTAAAWGLPMDSCLLVTNLRTLAQVPVRINDRGPHTRLVRQGRVIDLSRTAFARLGDVEDGLLPVQIEPCS